MSDLNGQVRVRFAPSPTGHLHIGGLRTALFNWLFARHYNGVFLLRIEDTDLERSQQSFTESILSSLAWLGIDHDEDIVIQSSRIAEHQRIARELVASGKAYRCYCTQEEVAERYQQKFGDAVHIKYDGHCRSMTSDLDKPYVIRVAMPDHMADMVFTDLIRGEILIPRDQFDDFIIVRSDGSPMYNFVVVVDDASMGITHIIRGEDHIANTPKQIVLYQALGYTLPQFAHIPLVLGPSGQRLSKREAATAVTEYKDAGYLPDALINYLARLGWSHGDQELFTKRELIEHFSLAHVSKSGAIFDIEKLQWLNSMYIRQDSPVALYDAMKDLEYIPQDHACALIALYKERVKALAELSQAVQVAYQGPVQYDAADMQKWMTAGIETHLDAVALIIENMSAWDSENISQALKEYAEKVSIKLVQLAQPLRLALVGSASGPGVFALLAELNKHEVLRRLALLKKQNVST